MYVLIFVEIVVCSRPCVHGVCIMNSAQRKLLKLLTNVTDELDVIHVYQLWEKYFFQLFMLLDCIYRTEQNRTEHTLI